MSGPRAVAVRMSAKQQELLQKLRRRQTACQRLVRRVQVLLALVADPGIEATARRLGLSRPTVRLWRDRWNRAADLLALVEHEGASEGRLLALIEETLDDEGRPGAPATFSPEQIVQIVATACEPPERSGRPISHWTTRELADEVKKRQIVSDIHPTTVGLFLKAGGPAAAQEPLLAEPQPRGPRGVPDPGGGGL